MGKNNCKQCLPSSEACVSCFACEAACGHGAINVCSDLEGFYFPAIDEAKCVSCRKCVQVCPVVNFDKNDKTNLREASCFASWDNSADVLGQSTSGGVFSSLCEHIFNEGGVVYGASFNSKWIVVHSRIDKAEDLCKLQGSKYVQSNMHQVGVSVCNDLAAGRKVLFSGTPCQVAGVKSLVPIGDRKKLFLVELICHGVPSPKIFRVYLDHIKKKYNHKKIKSIHFRSKDIGWKSPKFTVEFERYKYTIDFDRSPYIIGFLWNWVFRKSCYDCIFSTSDRAGDIVLGDFWHNRKKVPEYINDKGTSAVIALTDKGKELFDLVSKKTTQIPVRLNDISAYNSRLCNGKYSDLKYLLKKRKMVFDKIKYPEELFMDILTIPSLNKRVFNKLFRYIRTIANKIGATIKN